MKAVVRDRYGPPEVMRLEDVAVPSPRAGHVLVRVVATSVNLSGWEGLHGSPAYTRFGGLFRPSRKILGSDIAGVVESVGADVTSFRPGDEVYGDILSMVGGFAEYAVAPERPTKKCRFHAKMSPRRGNPRYLSGSERTGFRGRWRIPRHDRHRRGKQNDKGRATMCVGRDHCG